MKKSSSKGTRILQLVAGILFLLFLVGLFCVSYALLALAQEPAPVEIPLSNSVSVGPVVVPFNKKACDKTPDGNWYTTLSHYGGDVEAMLAANGFTPESFAECCKNLP